MYDFDSTLRKFQENKVNLSQSMLNKLSDHRQANEDRLSSRLKEKGISISKNSFISQGSFAMKTLIQTCFEDDEYDIDDGVKLLREDLKKENAEDKTPLETKQLIKEALKDKKFKKQPEIKPNCVRVFYSEDGKEKHHVDMPAYRTYYDENKSLIQELASVNGWIESDPRSVNRWFDNIIIELNKEKEGTGSKLRRMIKLLKRFARSRMTWDLPNGLKLTMLAVEKIDDYKNYERDDEAFYYLLESLKERLAYNLEIENLADDKNPKQKLTRTQQDKNVIELRDRIEEALEKLEILHKDDCKLKDAKQAWKWVFNTGDYFDDIEEDDDNEKKENQLFNVAVLSHQTVEINRTPAKPHCYV